ncbi:MAG: hypothetical protein U0414_05740 [Polyangiaceae bacterium]
MLMVFEVYFEPGAIPDTLLSDEVRKNTKAQMMTFEEAAAVGFGGLPKPAAEGVARLIAVADRDGKWIQRLLETSDIVAGFRVHHVDI